MIEFVFYKYDYIVVKNQLFDHCLSFLFHSMSINHFNILLENVLREETSVSSEMNDNLLVKLSDFENSECCLKKSSNKKGISLKRVTIYKIKSN